MRVSSLSDSRVIDLLNRYFVSSWLSRDRYQQGGPDKAEQAELQRIDRQRNDRKLEGGTVTVHILASDGTVVAALPVQHAAKPEELVAFLTRYLEREKVAPRRLLMKATNLPPWKQSRKPKSDDGILLNCWTRFDDGENRGVGADTVDLTRKEWEAFLPRKDAASGATWSIPDGVVDKLFQYAYPPLPNWDARQVKLLERSLTATIRSVTDGEMQLKLEGRFVLSYPATGKPTDAKVTAKIVGFATIDTRKGVIKDLKLTSTEASYVWFWENKPQPRKMSVAVELGE